MNNLDIAIANLQKSKLLTKMIIVIMSLLWSSTYVYFNILLSSIRNEIIRFNNLQVIEAIFLIGIACISIFLIICTIFIFAYMNKYKYENQKKEYGIYLLNGISLKKINKIALFENLIIAIITIIITFLFSIIFVQITTLIANQFAIYDIKIKANYSLTLLVTIFVFILIFHLVVVLLFMFKNKKNDLEMALTDNNPKDKVIEIGVKETIYTLICSILILICTTSLSRTFYINYQIDILITLLLALFGMGLFITSTLRGFYLFIPKSYYNKGFNSIIIGKIRYILNENASFLVISMFFIGSAIGVITISNIYLETMNESMVYDDFILNSKEGFTDEQVEQFTRLIEDNSGKVSKLQVYKIGHNVEEMKDFESQINILKLSEVNRYLQSRDENPLDLSGHQIGLASNMGKDSNITGVVVGEQTLTVTNYYKYNDPCLSMIFPDEYLDEVIHQENVSLNRTNYLMIGNVPDSFEIKLSNQLKSIYEQTEYQNIGFFNRYQIIKNDFIVETTISLISIVIAIILLLVIISIFALKLYIDAYDSQDDYTKLRELGMTEKELNKMIRLTINTMLYYPVLVALIAWNFGFAWLVGIVSIPINLDDLYTNAYKEIITIITGYVLYSFLIKHYYKLTLINKYK